MIWDITVYEYIKMGGWVMMPLIGLAFVLGWLIIERFLYFKQLQKDDITTDEIILSVQENKIGAVEKNGIHREIMQGLIDKKRCYGYLDALVVEEVEKKVVPELSRNMRSISALTAAAPLLGLLGTVSGMITTFNVMNVFGTGNAKAMSGGISQALVTTQFGLVVAIIGLYMAMILNQHVKKYETIAREATVHIIRKFNL